MHSALTQRLRSQVMQTYDDIVKIIRSLPEIKGVKVKINAAYWGEEWAASAEKQAYEGILDRWQNSEKKLLYVRWEGYSKCRLADLKDLKNDALGRPLNLHLLPYSDGSPPPTLYIPSAPAQQPSAGNQNDENQNGSDGRRRASAASTQGNQDRREGAASTGKVVRVHDQSWTLREPEFVATDARTQNRNKPALNTAGKELRSIEQIFLHVLPPKWLQLIVQYTNPLLDEADIHSAKLSVGELKCFIGYMISLALHSGIPLEKMWCKTALPHTTAPAPHMGRWGISQNRFEKLRRVLQFGPRDDASFDNNEWCFVEELVDTYNEHMLEAVTAGWLLGVDESMIAWRGQVHLPSVACCACFARATRCHPTPHATLHLIYVLTRARACAT